MQQRAPKHSLTNQSADDWQLDKTSETFGAGRPRTEDLVARNKNLLETASRLFVEQGYGQTSLEQIAREAHVAVRTIYLKFGGKSGLLQAVVEVESALFFENLKDIDLENDQRSVKDIMTDFGTWYLRQATSVHALSIQRLMVAEAKSDPELARMAYDAGPGCTIEHLNRFFARPEIKKQFKEDAQPQALSEHLLNCLIGDRLKWLLFGSSEREPEEAIGILVAQRLSLFFQGVLG